MTADRQRMLLFSIFAFGCFIWIFLHAMVLEDSYITFRVIDNLFHGYGLRWNIGERVQVYTHPLWLFLHIPFHLLFDNLYLINIGLSTAFAMAAGALMASLVEGVFKKAALILLPLVLSRTITEYAIAGLETPLNFFLLALFMCEYLRPRMKHSYYALWLIAALAGLARLDNIVILLPALGMATLREQRPLSARRWLAYTSPLSLWFLFSLFYYGFFLPNTKYAKRPFDIPVSDYLEQGLKYLYNFSYYDSFSAVMLLIAFGISISLWLHRETAGDESVKLSMLGAGALLHVAYVVYMGGDYMCGRFFADASWMSIAIVACYAQRRLPAPQCALVFAALRVFHQLVIVPIAPDTGEYTLNYGINDQPALYYGERGLFSDKHHFIRRAPNYSRNFLLKRLEYRHGDVVAHGYVGDLGYYFGPKTLVIDLYGLGDAFLARMPVRGAHWRIGHFPHYVPPGYYEMRETGSNKDMDPNLAQYYDKLTLVVTGPLWSADRFEAIVGFQLGWWDHWRDDYLQSLKP